MLIAWCRLQNINLAIFLSFVYHLTSELLNVFFSLDVSYVIDGERLIQFNDALVTSTPYAMIGSKHIIKVFRYLFDIIVVTK